MSFHAFSEMVNDLKVVTTLTPMFMPAHWWVGVEECILNQADDDLIDDQQIDSTQSGFVLTCQVAYSNTVYSKNYITDVTIFFQFRNRRDLDIFKLKHPTFCAEYFL